MRRSLTLESANTYSISIKQGTEKVTVTLTRGTAIAVTMVPKEGDRYQKALRGTGSNLSVDVKDMSEIIITAMGQSRFTYEIE